MAPCTGAADWMLVATTVSVPHALNEQAKHVTYMVDELQRRGGEVIEATPEGVQEWVDEMRSKARLAERFYTACTPGYYNNEGQLGNPVGFFTG